VTEETRNAEQLGKEAGGRRRRKGLSLSDISGRTKIRVQFLEAIENGTLQDLPQSLYARGFVRRYLEVIESQDLWAEYEQIFRSIPEKGEPAESLVHYMPTQKGFQKVSKTWVFLFLFFAIGISLYMIWQQKDVMSGKMANVPTRTGISGDVSTPAEDLLQVSEAETADGAARPSGVDAVTAPEETLPVARTGDTTWLPGHEEGSSSQEPAARSGGLTIRATGPCWIGVNRDDGKRVQRTLNAGDTFEAEIDVRTTIRFGSAGAVSLTWKEKDLGSIGRRGEVVTIEFLPDGTMKRL
jgi:cytoskeletal protein RodZ